MSEELIEIKKKIVELESYEIVLPRFKEADFYVVLSMNVGSDKILDPEDKRVIVDLGQLPRDENHRNLGKRIFARWSATLHKFLCNPGEEDEEIKTEFFKLLGAKDPALAGFLASTLVVSFGISIGTAVIVSALLVQLVLKPAGEEICLYWKESLENNNE